MDSQMPLWDRQGLRYRTDNRLELVLSDDWQRPDQLLPGTSNFYILTIVSCSLPVHGEIYGLSAA